MSAGSSRPEAFVDRIRDSDAGLILGTMLGLYVLFIVFSLLGPSSGPILGSIVSNLQTITFWTALYAMMVLALNLHWGYTGLFNIGVAGFMAVGVYTFAALTVSPSASPPGLGLPLWVGIVGGMLAAALVGAATALPALRLRADYLAIVTVALSEIIRLSLLSTTLQQFTLFTHLDFEVFGVEILPDVPLGSGSGRGITLTTDPTIPVKSLLYTRPKSPASGDPTALGRTLFNAAEALSIRETVVVQSAYTLVLILFVVGFYWLLVRIGNSPFGRVLKAIREDEVVANSLGKDTRIVKVKVFMVGCALMGLGGILWEAQKGFTDPTSTTFMPIQTFYIFIALMIGGAGSNTGSVLGGALFASLLFQGPLFVSRIISHLFELPTAPSSFYGAVEPFASLDPMPFMSYMLTNVPNLRYILVGVVLVYLMQNRPEGLLGHRKEVASSVDLMKRETDPGRAPAVADGGEDGE